MEEWSIRVTPPHQKEVIFDMDEFEQFIACKEIGKKHKKLHYHIYCKTTLNVNEIKGYLQLICDTNATGNGFFSCVKAHAGTKGYVVKEQVSSDAITQFKGFTKEQIDDIFIQSRKYRDDKEAERKQKYRHQIKTQKEIVDLVVADLEGVSADASVITQKILMQFKDSGELMPTRSAFERILNTVIAIKYGIDNFALEQYYLPRVYISENSDGCSRWYTPVKFSV